jgi:CheY-like chemotaxis protein
MAETAALPLYSSDVTAGQRERDHVGPPLRVLLAEDNKINQQFATFVLNRAGHSVEIATNGREAVEALRGADFDVVLMDIQMPELNGVQAALEIRALPEPKCKVPIIAVTAHAMTGAREEYLGAGMDDYISKPYQPALLLSMLNKVAGRGATPSQTSVQRASGAEAVVAETDDLPVLDLDQLNTFGSVFSVSKMKTLASLYMIDVEARLVLLAECRANNDLEGVSRQAHMIVSTAGNLGAKQTSALARLLEVSCVDRNSILSDRLITELRASCELSCSALKRWLIAGSQIHREGRN